MRASEQLDVLAGRIRDLAESEATLEMHYVRRGRTLPQLSAAALAIDCIGPESDYRSTTPLVRNVMRRGLMRRGPVHLGVDALLNGIGQNGAVSDVLYTLASSMRGVLWEVLAVPEIRVQAERLARLLINGGTLRPGKRRRTAQ